MRNFDIRDFGQAIFRIWIKHLILIVLSNFTEEAAMKIVTLIDAFLHAVDQFVLKDNGKT